MNRAEARTAALACALVAVLAGCADEAEDGGAADCALFLRFAGQSWTGIAIGDTEQLRAERIGRGQRSSCDDNGADSRGAYLDPTSPGVAVFSVRGAPVDEVVISGTSFFFAPDVSDDRQRRVLDDLTGRGADGGAPHR